MTYIIEIAYAAELDIREKYIWYENEQTSLGEKFQKQVLATISNLKKHPF